MFENNLRTKLEPYLVRDFGFDPNLLPDLSRRRFFQRDKIFEFLKKYKLSNFQLQSFLSFTYENILNNGSAKKQQMFLETFEKDLTVFSKDRAVIAHILHSFFDDSEKFLELLMKLEEIKIEKASVEAFDLVSRYIETIVLNGLAHLSARNAETALSSVVVLSTALKIDIKSFKNFFEEISEKFKKEIHINSAKVIAEFAKNL